MAIWTTEIKELERLYESFKGQLPELEKELEQLIHFDDPNVILLYSRRCLEVIITDLCECELKRPRKTEPLKGIIDKLNKEEKVPSNIITSMDHLNSLSAYGAHPKDFDPEQVKPVLNNLDIIIKWYLKYKNSKLNITSETEEVIDEINSSESSTEIIQKPKKRLIFYLSGFAIVVIVVSALFVLDIIGGGKQIREREKSIAVLPFNNDSPDEEKMYFINGTMEAILDNLCKIKDLRVPGRTSVEQYRENLKPIPTIAKELDVNYILEGSGHRDGNDVRLYVQLLDARKDKHLWSKTYDRDIEEIFSMQSEIAQLVAAEIEAIITPEEKQLIEKTPTSDLTAYDFYQRGMEEIYNRNIDRAEELFNEALECDSSYAGAYYGLSIVLANKINLLSDFYSDNFLDSVLILINKALSLDDQLSEAYTQRAVLYVIFGMNDLALADIEKAINLNPNDGMAYSIKSSFYTYSDFVKAIDNLHKAINIDRGKYLNQYFINLGQAYFKAGFVDKTTQYYKEALKLDGDSASYYMNQGYLEFYQDNYSKAIDFFQRSTVMGNKEALLGLGYSLFRKGRYREALEALENWIGFVKDGTNFELLYYSDRIALVYYINGFEKEAEDYFDMYIEYGLSNINSNRFNILLYNTYYELAGVYAFKGEKEKAYENLRKFNQIEEIPYDMSWLIKNDELFESIRDEPEFQQIVRDVEAKYQASHERVRKWLEEQGMLEE